MSLSAQYLLGSETFLNSRFFNFQFSSIQTLHVPMLPLSTIHLTSNAICVVKKKNKEKKRSGKGWLNRQLVGSFINNKGNVLESSLFFPT